MYGLEDRGLFSARAEPPRQYRLWGPPSQRRAAAMFVHSVVSRPVYVLITQYGDGAYSYVIWKQYTASDRAGRASRKLSAVLNFRPSRCEPLKANPCIQFPIGLLKVSMRECYYSSPSSADVTNAWSYTFTPPYVFMMY